MTVQIPPAQGDDRMQKLSRPSLTGLLRVAHLAVLWGGLCVLSAGCEQPAAPPQSADASKKVISTATLLDAVTPQPPNWPRLNREGLERVLEKRRGQLVLVDFWGTWCPRCRQEVPHLVELAKQVGEKDLKVVAIAAEEEGSMPLAGEFMLAKAAPFEMYFSDFGRSSRTCQEFDIPNCLFPHLRLYDRDGRLVGEFGSPEESVEQIHTALVKAIDEARAKTVSPGVEPASEPAKADTTPPQTDQPTESKDEAVKSQEPAKPAGE